MSAANGAWVMTSLSSLSKALLCAAAAAALAVAGGVLHAALLPTAPWWHVALALSAAAAAAATIRYLIGAKKSIRAISEVCMGAARGDLEARIVFADEHGSLGGLQRAVNHLLDIADAFVRESSAAMECVGRGKYFRKVLVRGLPGAFRKSAEAINAAVETMDRESSAAQRNLEASNAELRHRGAALEKRTRSMEDLSRMIQRMHGCQNEAELADIVRVFVPQILPGTPGIFYVMNSSRNFMAPVADWSHPVSTPVEYHPDDCWALRRGQPHLHAETSADVGCKHVDAAADVYYACIPLVAQGDIVGMLYLEFSADGEDGARPATLQRDALVVAENIALTLANLRLRETLRNQSIRDPLTDLFNRRYLEETMELDLARSARDEAPHACIMVDIDHFKRFNDTFGHQAGDAVLGRVGRILAAHVRKGDIACRYGGEEFTLLLRGAGVKDAVVRAERIREAVKNTTVTHQGMTMGPVTLSCGVAGFPSDGRTAKDILRAADAALLRAKRRGRDRIEQADIDLELRGPRPQLVADSGKTLG